MTFDFSGKPDPNRRIATGVVNLGSEPDFNRPRSVSARMVTEDAPPPTPSPRPPMAFQCPDASPADPPLVAMRQGLRLATFGVGADAAKPFEQAIDRTFNLHGRGGGGDVALWHGTRLIAAFTSGPDGRTEVTLLID